MFSLPITIYYESFLPFFNLSFLVPFLSLVQRKVREQYHPSTIYQPPRDQSNCLCVTHIHLGINSEIGQRK